MIGHPRICKHYLSTWFFLDLCLVALDYVTAVHTLVDAGASFGRRFIGGSGMEEGPGSWAGRPTGVDPGFSWRLNSKS